LEWVLSNYAINPMVAIITVGDIIDRGKFKSALKSLELLFEAKLKGGNVFICHTNHFAYHHISFYPADFWLKLNKAAIANFTEVFDLLPYAALTGNGIVACHGLPVHNLHDINNVNIGSSKWYTLVWGRLHDAMATPEYIRSVLKNNNCSVIIRSHDHYT